MEFYRLVFSSSQPEHVQWRGLVPHFYGLQTPTEEDGELAYSIVLGKISKSPFLFLGTM